MNLLQTCTKIFLDCDSTLSAMEGIDELAHLRDKKAEVEQLTHLAMNGQVKFEQVYGKRLAIIQPTYDNLVTVGNQYIERLVPGVKEFVASALAQGKEVYIISGGYSVPVSMLAKHLGIPQKNVYAVELHFDTEGNYQGYDANNPLTRSGGKRAVIRQLKADEQSLFIGDGSTDLEAKGIVGCMIGFGGVAQRQEVMKKADVFLMSFYELAQLEVPTVRS